MNACYIPDTVLLARGKATNRYLSLSAWSLESSEIKEQILAPKLAGGECYTEGVPGAPGQAGLLGGTKVEAEWKLKG